MSTTEHAHAQAVRINGGEGLNLHKLIMHSLQSFLQSLNYSATRLGTKNANEVQLPNIWAKAYLTDPPCKEAKIFMSVMVGGASDSWINVAPVNVRDEDGPTVDAIFIFEAIFNKPGRSVAVDIAIYDGFRGGPSAQSDDTKEYLGEETTLAQLIAELEEEKTAMAQLKFAEITVPGIVVPSEEKRAGEGVGQKEG